ncbi:hypothetical protein [Halomonas litopenaei]|uniref:hypothetical protein n=1 Tax=Halomonas litopenaei TaxID=2109328 RepID=UPI003F9EF33C
MTDDNETDDNRSQIRSHLTDMARQLLSDSEEGGEDELSARAEIRDSQTIQDQPSSSCIDHNQRVYQGRHSPQVSVPPQPRWPTEPWNQPFPQFPMTASSLWSQASFQNHPTAQLSDVTFPSASEQPSKSQHYRGRRVDRASDLIKMRYRLINSETNSRLLVDMHNGEVLPFIPEVIVEPMATAYRMHHNAEVNKSEIKDAFGHFRQLTQPMQESVFFGRAGYDPSTKERFIDAGQVCLAFRASTPMYETLIGKPHIRATQSLPLYLYGQKGNIHPQLIETLFEETALPKDSDLLVIAWMILGWMPDRAQVMLELIGRPSPSLEQTQTTLKCVLDPATVTMLNEIPRNAMRFNELAHQQYLLSFNQVETLTSAQQDHLYSLLQGKQVPWIWNNKKTGNEIRVQCPVMFNSLGSVDTKAKLADVTLSIEVEEKDTPGHHPEGATNIQQTTLYGLLTVFGKVHALWRDVEYESRFERYGGLKDLCRIGELVAKSLGRDPADFWQQFEANQQGRREYELEENPVALAVKHCLEDNVDGAINLAVKDWLKRLETYRPRGTPPEAWPATSQKLAAQFRKMQPMLRDFGIALKPMGRQGPNRYWRAERAGEPADQNNIER